VYLTFVGQKEKLKISLIVSGFIGGTESSTVSNDDDGLNYAIVIDAGSSGSRAYLYFWPEHSGSPKSLLKIDPLVDKHGEPLVKAVSPGLSR